MNRHHRTRINGNDIARSTFLERRVLELVSEARQKVAEGDLGPASQRLRSTCQFVLDIFGPSHPELPDLYQMLSDILDSLGARPDSEYFQTISFELHRFREREIRRLWQESGLARLLERPSMTGKWPIELESLRYQIEYCCEPPRFPEIAIRGSEASGSAGMLREIGRRAIDRLWRVRLLEYDELAIHGSRQDGIRDLDVFSLLLIEGVDPSLGGDADLERWLRQLLQHRRGKSSTILAVLPEPSLSVEKDREPGSDRSLLGRGGTWIDLEPRAR